MGVRQPLVPLSDGAGEVEDVGASVTRLKKGDRVVGLFFPRWQSGRIDADTFASARGGEPTDGMLSQHVCGHENGFVKFPDYLSFEEASTLPCAGLTAWNAIVVQGRLTPGESVVILGTGGVALFGLQIAKTIGARVILISSSDEKLERARAMGADVLINYTKAGLGKIGIAGNRGDRRRSDPRTRRGRNTSTVHRRRQDERADQPGWRVDRI